MNAEETIIAFLNGDLRDESQAAMLMRDLAESPERRRLLLQHVQASRRLSSLGKRTAPSVAAIAGVLNAVADYDRMEGYAQVPTGRKAANVPPGRLISFGILLALGFLLGYCASLLHSSGEKNASATHDLPGPANLNPRDRSGLSAADSLHRSASSSENAVGDTSGKFGTSASSQPDLSSTQPPHSSAEHGAAIRVASSSSVEQSPFPSTALRIIIPNGGEEFSAGDVVPLVWSGLPNEQPVTLTVSSDQGTTWNVVGRNITGGRMLWTIPDDAPAGTHYLLKAAADTSESDPVLEDTFLMGTHSVDDIAFSPDGTILAIAVGNGVILRDIATKSETGHLSGHTDDIYSVDFSPDGSRIATGSRDGTVMIWDVRTMTREHIIDPGCGYIWRGGFSPDGKSLATICRDDSAITFWDVETGKQSKVFRNIHSRTVRFVDYTVDGTRLLTAGIDRSVAVTDVRTGKVLQRVIHHTGSEQGRPTIVMGAQLTPDDSVLITCGYDGLTKFWNARTGELIREKIYHNGKYALAVRLSRDGRFLISVGYDGRAELIDPYTGDVLAEMTLNAGDAVSPMLAGKLGADDSLLAIGHTDGKVSLWRMGNGTVKDMSDNLWTVRPYK